MKLLESAEQRALLKRVRLGISQFPELQWLYAIPNGGNLPAKNRMRMMAEGLLPGVCDLHLPIARGGYHGLFIEMKTEKGKVSEPQRVFMNAMAKEGHCVVVARSWFAAWKILHEYLSGSVIKGNS